MTCGEGFFGFLKMKILKNLTTSVMVKILRKQGHKKINPCKKGRKHFSKSLIS